jgi:hypothetical protein
MNDWINTVSKDHMLIGKKRDSSRQSLENGSAKAFKNW